jgi:opacity protein-like surface antigen
MSGFKSFVLVPCVVLMTAAVAPAQAPVAQTSPFERGYMTGTAGAAFGDQQTATFGVELADHINRHVQAFVNFTYFDDLITDSAQSELDDLGATLTRLTGTPWEFAGHDRGLLFSGGAKYLFANGSNVRPYLGAAPGVLNLRRTIVESLRGDLSDEVLSVFGAPGGVIDAEQSSTYKPTAEFLAGVGIAAGRTYVDVGYRYRHIFKTDDSFKFSQFSVGVGMRF